MDYRLLQDTPTDKAGTIAKPAEVKTIGPCYILESGYKLNPKYVENNPEWFKPEEDIKALLKKATKQLKKETDGMDIFEALEHLDKKFGWGDYKKEAEPEKKRLRFAKHSDGEFYVFFYQGGDGGLITISTDQSILIEKALNGELFTRQQAQAFMEKYYIEKSKRPGTDPHDIIDSL